MIKYFEQCQVFSKSLVNVSNIVLYFIDENDFFIFEMKMIGYVNFIQIYIYILLFNFYKQ